MSEESHSSSYPKYIVKFGFTYAFWLPLTDS